MRLSDREWAVLREMARSLYRNIEDAGSGYWTVGDTLIESEVSLLKKLADGDVEFNNETATRVLNFVMPYIPEHIREEAINIVWR